MVVKAAGKYLSSDKLHRLPGDKKPDNGKAWKNVMYAETDMSAYSRDYIALLKDKFGGVIDEEWVQNLVL
jgi:hypothetical protein